MPIRPENKALYPREWREISERIRFVRAGGRCEWRYPNGTRCRARHGRRHPVTGATVVLTVAHLDHDPRNCEGSNLRAWCQLHHNQYDAGHRAETRRRDRNGTVDAAGAGDSGGVERAVGAAAGTGDSASDDRRGVQPGASEVG